MARLLSRRGYPPYQSCVSAMGTSSSTLARFAAGSSSISNSRSRETLVGDRGASFISISVGGSAGDGALDWSSTQPED